MVLNRWIWWYNTNAHSSTGITPFKAVYEQPPPRLLSYVPETTQVQAVDDQLRSKKKKDCKVIKGEPRSC